MKLLVSGDRNWGARPQDKVILCTVLDEIHEITPISLLIEGGAAGADIMARTWARARKEAVLILEICADWKKYGRAAGPVRNVRMLDECPDLVVGFHAAISHSKGTKHCLSVAAKRGIPVRLYTHRADKYWTWRIDGLHPPTP